MCKTDPRTRHWLGTATRRGGDLQQPLCRRTHQFRFRLWLPRLEGAAPPVARRSETARRRLFVVIGDGSGDLGLDRFHVETRALLHRRELDEALRRLADLLLDEDEAPELVGEPVIVGE